MGARREVRRREWRVLSRVRLALWKRGRGEEGGREGRGKKGGGLLERRREEDEVSFVLRSEEKGNRSGGRKLTSQYRVRPSLIP